MSENKMKDHIQWIQWIEDDQWSIHWLRSVSKIILSFYDWNIFRFGVWRANSWFMIKPRRFLQNFCLFNKWYVPYLPLISTPIKKDTDLIWGITQIKPGKKPNYICFICTHKLFTQNYWCWCPNQSTFNSDDANESGLIWPLYIFFFSLSIHVMMLLS